MTTAVAAPAIDPHEALRQMLWAVLLARVEGVHLFMPGDPHSIMGREWAPCRTCRISDLIGNPRTRRHGGPY